MDNGITIKNCLICGISVALSMEVTICICKNCFDTGFQPHLAEGGSREVSLRNAALYGASVGSTTFLAAQTDDPTEIWMRDYLKNLRIL